MSTSIEAREPDVFNEIGLGDTGIDGRTLRFWAAVASTITATTLLAGIGLT